MRRRARDHDQDRILDEALARVARRAPTAVAVFDLDSTLMDNKPRQARILGDFGRSRGVAALAAARPEHWRAGWDLGLAMRAAGLAEADVVRLLPEFRAFWLERFFTSEYCRSDVPVAGAPAYVREVVLAGGCVAYVTGRPAAMADGTLEAFRRAELPLPDARRVFLLMKPSPEISDDAWKAAACVEVERIGPPVVAFDNEPAHVNAYAEAWPNVYAVHVDTEWSPRPVEVLERIPSIADFRRG